MLLVIYYTSFSLDQISISKNIESQRVKMCSQFYSIFFAAFWIVSAFLAQVNPGDQHSSLIQNND